MPNYEENHNSCCRSTNIFNSYQVQRLKQLSRSCVNVYVKDSHIITWKVGLSWDNGKKKRDSLFRRIFFSYSKSYLNWFLIYNIVIKSFLTILLGIWTRMINYSFTYEKLNHSVPEGSSPWTYKTSKSADLWQFSRSAGMFYTSKAGLGKNNLNNFTCPVDLLRFNLVVMKVD